MADLVPDFGSSASGVSPGERGTGSEPFKLAGPRAPRREAEAPEPRQFIESDQAFAESLLLVLVREPYLWARVEELPLPPVKGVYPRNLPDESQETLNERLPPGGFETLRNQFLSELQEWERYAEGVVMENDRALKEAAIRSLLRYIEQAFATTPGPDIRTMDWLAAVQGAVGLALGAMLERLGGLGSAIGAGIDTIASIIANHVTEAIALEDLQQRRALLERSLERDRRLFRAWGHEIYRIDRIQDYYLLWLERVPNEQILDFRIPFSPESHPEQEFEATLDQALARAGVEAKGGLDLNPLKLYAWLEERGISVTDEDDLKKMLYGEPIQAEIRHLLSFPGAAFRPPVDPAPSDRLVVSLFPQLVDATRQEPEGILVVHMRTSHAFLYRFSDGLYHEAPR